MRKDITHKERETAGKMGIQEENQMKVERSPSCETQQAVNT